MLHDGGDHGIALLDQVLDVDPELLPGLLPVLRHAPEALVTVVRSRVRHAVRHDRLDVLVEQLDDRLEVAAVVGLDPPPRDVQALARHD